MYRHKYALACLLECFQQILIIYYYGVFVTLDRPYGQPVTVSGNIISGDPAVTPVGFSLTISPGLLRASTYDSYYETTPGAYASAVITSVTPCPAQSLTVVNGTVNFGSLSLYEQYAENILNRNDIVNLYTGSLNVITLAEIDNSTGSRDSDYPDFLKMILNTDSIFTFSHYLVKVDLPNHRALVIDNNNTNAYQTLLTNNLSATGVMNFSDDVDNAIDVLEQIESGSLLPSQYETAVQPSAGFRSCGGAGKMTAKDVDPIVWKTVANQNSGCPDNVMLYGMDNKVVYEKAIIYFSLQSKIKSLKAGTCTNWTFVPYYSADIMLSGSAKYSKRCGTEQFYTKTDGTYGTVLHWRPYENSRSLSKYDMTVDFGIRDIGSSANYFSIRSYHIMWGY